MTIKNKLTASITVLAVLSTIVACLGVGALSINAANETIHGEAMRHLISVRETKKAQIERYFEQINNQVLTLANDRMIIDATKRFKHSLFYRRDAEDIAFKRARLKQYYTKHFAEEYRKRNAGGVPNAVGLLKKLDKTAVELQYQYIQTNVNPLGKKDNLNKAQDGSEYSNNHSLYHPHIRDYLNKFGYYDIFIVDPDSGRVIYSVFKELDICDIT